MDYDSMSPDSPPSPIGGDPATSDIPILLDGTVRWVTGLTKRTTCDDVIYALLYSDGKHGGESTENYAIFERWRDVEKPLQARTKIVKIWRAWGADQCNVELCVRRLRETGYLSGDTYRHRRRHRRSSKHRTRHYGDCGCRPGTHRNCYSARGKMGPLESLVKLVIAQERTLHLLGQRIWRTDEKIDTLETDRHFSRVKDNGDNYVQSAYLDSLSEDSMDEIFGNVRTEDIDEYIAFCARIIKLEEILTEKQEQVKEAEKLLRRSRVTCEVPGTSRSYEVEPDSPYDEEVEQAQVDMNRLVTAGVMQRYQEAAIKRELQHCDKHLDTKRQLIRSLNHDLNSLHEHRGQGRDLKSMTDGDMGQGRDLVSSPASENPQSVAQLVHGHPQSNGMGFTSTAPNYHSHSCSLVPNMLTNLAKQNVPVERPPDITYRAGVFPHNMDYVQEKNSMENTTSETFDDESDRVSVIQIFDSPPKNRSKSVTFNDGLNHMHVIGTYRESLSERPAGAEGSGVRKSQNVYANATPYKRQPERPAPQHKVVSILKNNSNKNHIADFTRTSSTHAQTTQREESTLDKLASAHVSGRYHLPSVMYTFAKDGHYFLPDSTHRPYKEEDSNSDTGLSSMHSDESPGLETLV